MHKKEEMMYMYVHVGTCTCTRYVKYWKNCECLSFVCVCVVCVGCVWDGMITFFIASFNPNSNKAGEDLLRAMSSVFSIIGIPGQPWGKDEKEEWARAQSIQRSYDSLVLERIRCLEGKGGFEVHQYGTLVYSGCEPYPLFALKTLEWDDNKPTVLVTGGGKLFLASFCQLLPHYD